VRPTTKVGTKGQEVDEDDDEEKEDGDEEGLSGGLRAPRLSEESVAAYTQRSFSAAGL
jgi:hypothetical protein